jgi:hypothetical protein
MPLVGEGWPAASVLESPQNVKQTSGPSAPNMLNKANPGLATVVACDTPLARFVLARLVRVDTGMQFATALRPPDVRPIAKFLAKVARVVAGVVPYQLGCRPKQGDGQGHRFRGGEPQGALKIRQHEPMPTNGSNGRPFAAGGPSGPDAIGGAKLARRQGAEHQGVPEGRRSRRQAPTVNQSIGAPHGCGGKGEHRITMPLWPFRRA